MGKMTGAEHSVADFLTKNNIKWLYEKPLYLTDLGERPRLFNPDFYLTDIGLYVEVCGAPRNEDYSRRDRIYKKNNVPIIFIETYKSKEKWEFFLKRSIIEFAEKQNSKFTELKLLKKTTPKSNTKSNTKINTKKEIDNKWNIVVEGIDNIHSTKSNDVEYKNIPKTKSNYHSKESNIKDDTNTNNQVKNKGMKKYINYFSNQTLLGIWLLGFGVLIFHIILIFNSGLNIFFVISLILLGIIIFLVGLSILNTRLDKWYTHNKPKYDKWIRK